MKTPEQISQWLQKQPWYPQFVENATKTLIGEYGASTFLLAFNWGETDEGREFWEKINGQFRRWYNEEEKQ